MRVRQFCLLLALLLAVPGGPAGAQDDQASSASTESEWITLGTRGGPVPSATRSQPANLLFTSGHTYLVDAGDGAAEQLAKLAIVRARLDAVFISHLHFDHTAGLAGILGLRFQTNAPAPLTIYGPPGTREMVDGLLASMKPGAAAGYGVPGAPERDPANEARVIELRDGDSVKIDGMTVSVRKNTHYSFAPGSDLEKRFQSLSLRFDMPKRSIVYTGDTGPSSAVEDLAKGANLLVTEMMDVDDTIAQVRRSSPNLDARNAATMEEHLRTHHLTPSDVGELAARAGVGAVVVTHFVGIEPGDPRHLTYLRAIAATYNGPAVIANDMDAF